MAHNIHWTHKFDGAPRSHCLGCGCKHPITCQSEYDGFYFQDGRPAWKTPEQKAAYLDDTKRASEYCGVDFVVIGPIQDRDDFQLLSQKYLNNGWEPVGAATHGESGYLLSVQWTKLRSAQEPRARPHPFTPEEYEGMTTEQRRVAHRLWLDTEAHEQRVRGNAKSNQADTSSRSPDLLLLVLLVLSFFAVWLVFAAMQTSAVPA